MNTVVIGRPLHEHGTPVRDVHFPNGGVFSVVHESMTVRSWTWRPWGVSALHLPLRRVNP